MANKKKNEIIEEQQRARENFLKLKKMQHGEMEAPPKPSEVAVLPSTPKEKLSNFWYQYKLHLILSFVSVAILAFLIAQCAGKTRYDFKIIYFAHTPTTESHIAAMADYLEDYGVDLNGDGVVEIQTINCSFEKNNGNVQYQRAVLTKLQAAIAADSSAFLFIADEDGYEYLNNISDGISLFEDEPTLLGEDFYKAANIEGFEELPEGLTISCRRLKDTALENKKDADKVYEASKKLIENLKK